MRKQVPLMTLVVLLATVWSTFAYAQNCPSRADMKKEACDLTGFDAQVTKECLVGAEMELNATTIKSFDRGQDQDANLFISQLEKKQSCGQIRPQAKAPGDLSLRQNIETFKAAELDNGNFNARYGGECAAQRLLCDCAAKNLDPKIDCNKKFNPQSQFDEANRSFTNIVELNKSLIKTASSQSTGSKSDLGKDAMQGLNAAMPALMMAAQMMARQQQDDGYPQQPYDTMSAPPIDSCAPGADGSSVCAVMPQTAGSATGESWNKGSSAYSMGDNKTGGSFNPTDMGAVGGLGGGDGIAPASASGGGMAGAGIPNGGGGGIPGGGSAGAALGATSTPNPGGNAASGRADIMRGESGGGGYTQQNASMSTAAGNGGGFSGYGKANTMERLNLAEFLPGGRKDPVKRGLAGAGNATYVQIQSKEVNIWNRISERMKSRCTQGLLKDCIH